MSFDDIIKHAEKLGVRLACYPDEEVLEVAEQYGLDEAVNCLAI